MRNSLRSFSMYSCVLLLAGSMATTLLGQDAHSAARNVADMQFGQVPGLPTCATAAVQSGDPTKGPSILLAKMAAGCSIPWHWHTPNENLMMVTGAGRVEMKDEKTAILQAGGFARMPSKHAHQFSCASECLFYVFSDAAFDLHYLDGEGKEIAPDQALKKIGETAAGVPK